MNQWKHRLSVSYFRIHETNSLVALPKTKCRSQTRTINWSGEDLFEFNDWGTDKRWLVRVEYVRLTEHRFSRWCSFSRCVTFGWNKEIRTNELKRRVTLTKERYFGYNNIVKFSNIFKYILWMQELNVKLRVNPLSVNFVISVISKWLYEIIGYITIKNIVHIES